MAAKKLTPAQQRDRRAKIMLGVLGVVLLAVLAFQLPSLMKGSGSGSAAPPPVPATTSSVAVGGVAVPVAGQLTRFSRFAPKDPFKAKVVVGSSGGASTGATTPTTPAASQPKPAKQPKPAPIELNIKQAPLPSGPRVPAALILFNGKKHLVVLNAVFPAKNPVFRLVALGQHEIWLQLIGGTLGNGQQTLKLTKGRPLTLVNATMGIHIVLSLVKPTTAPKPPVTVTVTPPSTATTSTTTTSSTPTTTTTG